jgi:uncharacterized RDD family membrane protein YckC
MNWYFAEQGQKVGPVDDAQFQELCRTGRIQADTLVWREGMVNWTPYGQVEAKPSFTLKLGGEPSSGAGAAAAVGGPEAVCAECNRIFPRDSMIRYGDAYVCASCKPIFMQKLSEGARTGAGGMVYAGFWVRFSAMFLDGIIIWVVNFMIGLAMGTSSTMLGNSTDVALSLQLIFLAIQLTIGVSYETFMVGKFGATLGKMACKIHVVTADNGRVSYLRAFARYFSKILSYILCFIGFIIAGFDREKRALHDHICGTRVVYK